MAALITVILGIATTFVLFAIAIGKGDFFKSAPDWLVPVLIVVAACLYLLAAVLAIVNWLHEKREKDKPVPALLPPPIVRDIAQKVEAHPQQIVNIGPEFLKQLKETAKPNSAPQLEAPRPPKPKPNIVLAGTKWIDAHQGIPNGVIYESPNEQHSDFKVYVVCFRNKSLAVGQQLLQPHLKSHIIYKDINGNEIAESPKGVWLGRYGEDSYFEEMQKRCLVIFLLDQTDRLHILRNDSQYTQFGNRAFTINSEDAPDGIASVEVSLLTDELCLKQATYGVVANDDGPPSLQVNSEADLAE